jgi:hypothetical protein
LLDWWVNITTESSGHHAAVDPDRPVFAGWHV